MPAVVVFPSAVKYNPEPLLSPVVSALLGDTPQLVHPEHVDSAELSFVVVVVQELSLYQPVASVFLYIYCSIPSPQNLAIEMALQFGVQLVLPAVEEYPVGHATQLPLDK